MNTTNLKAVAQSLRTAGYEPVISPTGSCIELIVPHGQDRNVRNAIPMWQWFWFGVRTGTIHEHDRDKPGNDIIEITVR